MEDLNSWIGYARQVAGAAGDIKRTFDGAPENPGLTPEQQRLKDEAARGGVAPWWQKPQTLAIAAAVLLALVWILKKK